MLSCSNGPLESDFCPLMKLINDNIHNTRNLALLIKSMFMWLGG